MERHIIRKYNRQKTVVNVVPRRGSSIEKVVSTKLSIEDFQFLESYAKECYNKNLISMPTISHVLRFIVSKYKTNVRAEAKGKEGSKMTVRQGTNVPKFYQDVPKVRKK